MSIATSLAPIHDPGVGKSMVLWDREALPFAFVVALAPFGRITGERLGIWADADGPL